jgi:hypothetical protein
MRVDRGFVEASITLSKITLPRFGILKTWQWQLYPLPYRAARSFTRNPIFRFLGSGGAMSSRIASNTIVSFFQT